MISYHDGSSPKESRCEKLMSLPVDTKNVFVLQRSVSGLNPDVVDF